MLKKEILIVVLAVFLCLGLTGVAMALEYDEGVFEETNSSMQMEAEHGEMHGAMEGVTPEAKNEAEMKELPRLVCATHTSIEVEPATTPCLGG